MQVWENRLEERDVAAGRFAGEVCFGADYKVRGCEVIKRGSYLLGVEGWV